MSTELDRRGILEALLFVAEEPLPLAKLQEVLADEELSATEASVRELTLNLEREGRGLMVQEVAGGFRLATRPEAHAWIQRLQQIKPARLKMPRCVDIVLCGTSQSRAISPAGRLCGWTASRWRTAARRVGCASDPKPSMALSSRLVSFIGFPGRDENLSTCR